MPIDDSSSGHHQAPLNEGSHRESNADVNLQQKSQKLGFQVSRMFPCTSEDINCTTYAACFLFFWFRVAHCAWSHWFSPEKRRHKRCLSCAWTFFVFFASSSRASTFGVEGEGGKNEVVSCSCRSALWCWSQADARWSLSGILDDLFLLADRISLISSLKLSSSTRPTN